MNHQSQAPNHTSPTPKRLPDPSLKLAEKKFEVLLHSLSDAEYAAFIVSISGTLIYKAMLRDCPKILLGFVLYHALSPSEFSEFVRRIEAIIENRIDSERCLDIDKDKLIDEAVFQLSFLSTSAFYKLVLKIPRYVLESAILSDLTPDLINDLIEEIKEEKAKNE